MKGPARRSGESLETCERRVRRHRCRCRAARVANQVTTDFIQSNLERRYEASAYARSFLESRLAQVRQKLEDSERELAAYATSQQIINVGTVGATKNDPNPAMARSR